MAWAVEPNLVFWIFVCKNVITPMCTYFIVFQTKKLDFQDLQIYLTALTTVRRRRASVIWDQMTEAGFAGGR
jgi:hypothetical protein